MAWRASAKAATVAVLMGFAGALAVAPSLDGRVAALDSTTAPDEWLVDAALAFNAAASSSPPTAGGDHAGAFASSLPVLAERLAARLEEAPDDPAGWALLATTYRQLGREAEAGTAERRALESGADRAMIAGWHPEAAQAARPAAVPATDATWSRRAAAFAGEGQRLRAQRRFAEAEAAFRSAVELNPEDADNWADLADCAAAAAGKDLTAGREAIGRALSIEPKHRKALWLQASLHLQEGRFAEAAATWRILSTLVSPGSSDARVIAANIAEAEALAARPLRAG